LLSFIKFKKLSIIILATLKSFPFKISVKIEADARDIAQMMVTYGTVKSNQVEQVAEMIKQRSDKYRYSKYLVMILLTTITNAPAQIRDQVVQDFYLYASSQATYSAPYIKLE